MYSESELAAAVEAGALSPQAAEAFRDYVAASRATPSVDEEQFRLLSGFNDIFVAIATMLILVAAARIGAFIGDGLLAPGSTVEPRVVGASLIGGGAVAAGTSWLLAEYFTRRRRMALPSIILMLAFVGGVATALGGLFTINMPWIEEQLHIVGPDQQRQVGGTVAAGIALLTAIAAWLHWRRFMVPITVAAGALSLVGIGIALIIAYVPGAQAAVNPMLLAAGLIVFAVAMAWDMSDLERRTRRSDVAFWLHLAAAPLIAHPIFHMLGIFDGTIAAPVAVLVIGLYVLFAIVALAVDRRALLVSSLIYVLWAMYTLFNQTGNVELSASLTGLVIGSALLTLSAFWQPMRRGVVGLLGGLESRLPPTRQPALA